MLTFPLRFLLLFLVGSGAALARAGSAEVPEVAPRWTTQVWSAFWIAAPGVPGAEAGVFHFRKDFELAAVPAQLVVHVSADNRYRFFVNGRSIGVGPARGDLAHWRFETYDLAPYLRAGRNSLAAVVWNGGEDGPVAQMSSRTGFILQAEGEWEKELSTGASWRVARDEAQTPLPVDRAALQTYIVVGDGELFDARKHDWEWATADLSAPRWLTPRSLEPGFPHGAGSGSLWQLVPRRLPPVEETPQRLARVRRATGEAPPAGWLAGHAPWTVPPHREVTVLVDADQLTTAYPELETSGGAGAVISLRYAEALFDAQRQKGHRDEIEGKTLLGIEDRYLPGGGGPRVYAPLWYRTFRYLELHVKTGDEPLTLHDLRARFTAYPFVERGRFASDDPRLSQLWSVGWRTARLCAFETYMDCPYYEQLQYVGDTRIQALISLYVSGDDRLLRNAIELYDHSRTAEGLTQSRYPSAVPQVINTFSLFWIDMVHDYWRHREDAAFLRQRLAGVRAVLGWFADRVDARTGLLGPLPYWSFVDWADAWAWDPISTVGGVPDGAGQGGSSIISLQYAISLRHAADLMEAHGLSGEAADYRRQADALVTAVRRLCWDPARSYFSDTPERRTFSQHANTFAVLAGAVTGNEARDLITRTMADQSLIGCTLYFRFYLLRAAKQAGLASDYLAQLEPWYTMLDRGLTTFAEKADPTRSDCHAWSASPNYELLATVCGIEPGSPGFATVRVAPALGALSWVEGSVPHPRGLVTVRVDRRSGQAVVELPEGVSGTWVWAGREQPLRPGRQEIALGAPETAPKRN